MTQVKQGDLVTVVDVVWLKSGSPPMRPVCFDDRGDVLCAWSDASGRQQCGVFPGACLTTEKPITEHAQLRLVTP